MAGLGLVAYDGSDEEEDVRSEVSEGAAAVVLLGGYADRVSRQDTDAAQPSAQPGAVSEAQDGSEPMAVDANLSGASPSHMSPDKSALLGMTPQSGAAADEGELDGLPPHLVQLPSTKPDPLITSQIETLLATQQRTGKKIKNELRALRGYRNPDYLRDQTERMGIQEFGSNFPKEIFDPTDLHKEDFYEALRKAWEAEQDRRAKERQATGRVEFVKGGGAPAPARSAGASLPGGGSVAAVAAKARAQAVAAAALKGKGSRWG